MAGERVVHHGKVLHDDVDVALDRFLSMPQGPRPPGTRLGGLQIVVWSFMEPFCRHGPVRWWRPRPMRRPASP